MQTLVEHGCGLDVHQATVVACLLWVRSDGRVQKQLRTFGTTTRELVQKGQVRQHGFNLGTLKFYCDTVSR